MNDINIDDFKKLQNDVTEIKNALLGTEFTEIGLIKKVRTIEFDIKSNCEILNEVVRWKAEAQKWKEEATTKLREYEQTKWKVIGIITAASVIMPVLWGYIKVKLGL